LDPYFKHLCGTVAAYLRDGYPEAEPAALRRRLDQYLEEIEQSDSVGAKADRAGAASANAFLGALSSRAHEYPAEDAWKKIGFVEASVYRVATTMVDLEANAVAEQIRAHQRDAVGAVAREDRDREDLFIELSALYLVWSFMLAEG